jgi:hypothetical protein
MFSQKNLEGKVGNRKEKVKNTSGWWFLMFFNHLEKY